MPPQTPADLLAQFEPLIKRLYDSSSAADCGLSLAQFAGALHQSVTRAGPGSDRNIEELLSRLHAGDLALAAACRLGMEAAWNQFVARFRPLLYNSARAIVRDEFRARELADSLYAELYGLEIRAGHRRSLLQYFDGRSSLATWLHAVMARRFIDGYRRERRMTSLEDCPPGVLPQTASSADPPDPAREHYLAILREALENALVALPPRDRLRLRYYYVEELTLKQIGNLLGEYESTCSRRLGRTRKALRRDIERALRRNHRLTDEQIRLCYDYAAGQWPFDLTQALSDPVGS